MDDNPKFHCSDPIPIADALAGIERFKAAMRCPKCGAEMSITFGTVVSLPADGTQKILNTFYKESCPCGHSIEKES